jgi:hypothetical protein
MRVLRLTMLAPDIVEATLDGKQGPEVTLAQVLEYPCSSIDGRSPFKFLPQQSIGEDQ